ncbi:MAG: hypothetical protein WC533_02330 [Candidatus Pacearchaeota archaeon]
MKPNLSLAEDYLTRFSEEITKSTPISLRKVKLVKTNLKGKYSKALLCAVNNEVRIDPEKEYPAYVSLEHVILHELGHISQMELNPDMETDASEYLIGCVNESDIKRRLLKIARFFFSGKIRENIRSIETMVEGSAECFALDIFPEVCTLSDEGRKFIYKRKENALQNCPKCFVAYGSRGTLLGYRFFHELFLKEGVNGLIEFIESISERGVPTKEQLLNPKSYFIDN